MTWYLPAPEALGDLLPDEPRFRADQLRQWLYRSPRLTAGELRNLPLPLRERIGPDLWPFTVDLERTADGGTTRKWLFKAPDGASIESVLMGYPKRMTLCISSQAGCAMACTFCATGQFGFERHLEPGEIVPQVAYANASLHADPMPDMPQRVTNVVFMGMGEPLANIGRVEEALRRMIDVMGLGARSITVSTVGVVPGIRRLAHLPWQVNLAISLHAADDDLRSELVPLNRRYPIEDVLTAAEEYFESTGRRVSLEWTLMSGRNDDDRQARHLARIAQRLKAHVNVINLNPTPMTDDRPSGQESVERFLDILRREGTNATLRDTRGLDIDAACGQLRIERSSGDPTVRLRPRPR